MKKVLTSIFILLFLLSTSSLKSQEIKFKALYLYNFTKYVGWPASAKSGDFIIGVIGSNAIYNKLNEIAAGKMAGSQKIVIKKFNDVASITNCHILFIASGKGGTNSMKAIMEKVGDNNTLVVTERGGATAHGSAINFVIRNEQMKFELKKANALKQKLQISLNLEKLAITVN
ncbi:MAG: YfiR family protein [Chlorobi bacterium]|nr:YfiR family protein [Chlorobiota bacterium]